MSAYNFLDFDGGWGAIVGQSSFAYTLDVTSTNLTTVFSSAAYQLRPRAHGAAVIWSDWTGGKAVVRGWTAQGDTRVLAQGPWDVADQAISDTRIVWIGATGPNTLSGEYETARLYWSPRKLDPDQLEINSSVDLPSNVSPVMLSTWGKWAATRTGDLTVLIADLDANVLWKIPAKPGHWMDVLTISDTELLLADNVSGSQASQILDELVRYDLSKLADYAEKVP